MTRWQQIGYHLRWGWLFIWGVMMSLWVGKFIEPMVDHTRQGDLWYLPHNFFRVPIHWTLGRTAFDHEGFIGFLGGYHIDTFYLGWGLLFSFILMHVPLIADVLHRRHRYPARRKLTVYTLLAASLAWAFVVMAGACIVLNLADLWWPFVTLGASSPRAGWTNPGSSRLPLITFAGLWLLCFFALALRGPRRQRYWQLHHLTLALTLAAAVVMFIAVFASRQTTPKNFTGWNYHVVLGSTNMHGYTTAFILAGTALVWAWGYRTLLLFQLHWMHKRGMHHHECAACGYNLTGSAMAHRESCPECGAAIPPEQAEYIRSKTPPPEPPHIHAGLKKNENQR